MTKRREIDRGAFRRVEIGLLLVMVGGALVVVTADATHTAAFPSWAPFAFPAFEMTISLQPPIGASEAAMDRWLQELWIGIWYGVTLVVYYVFLGAVTIGTVLIFSGAVGLRDSDSTARRVRRLARERRLHVAFVGSVALLGVSRLPVWGALLEIIAAVVVAGPLLAGLAVATRRAIDPDRPVRSILLGYPFGVATVVLPVIAARSASETVDAFARDAGGSLVIAVLDVGAGYDGTTDLVSWWVDLPLLGSTAVFVVLSGWLLGAVVVGTRRIRSVA